MIITISIVFAVIFLITSITVVKDVGVKMLIFVLAVGSIPLLLCVMSAMILSGDY